MLLQQTTSQILHMYFSSAVWITAGITVLAMFSRPCPLLGLVQRVVAIDDQVYARAVIPDAYEPILDSYSADGGQTWQFLSDVPAGIAKELEQKVILPKIVCDPANLQLCYRIAGQGQVEESMDGGGSWRVAWSLPEARRSYMERVAHCHKTIEVGPYDLALISRNGMGILVVAIGNEGVLVRTAAGDWQRYAVEPAYGLAPTPYVAENFLMATWIMPAEIGIWLLAGLFTWLYLWLSSVNTILERMKNWLKPERSAPWVTRPVALLAVALISLCLLIIGILSYKVGLYTIYLLAGLVIILPLLSYVLTWQRVARIAYQPRQAWLAAGIGLLTGIAIFPLAWIPFPLWALGIISRYELALTLSIPLTALILWWGIRQAGRVSARASTPMMGERGT